MNQRQSNEEWRPTKEEKEDLRGKSQEKPVTFMAT
jgi:hypothetical protein